MLEAARSDTMCANFILSDMQSFVDTANYIVTCRVVRQVREKNEFGEFKTAVK